jgi:hypothetical protein
VVHFRAGQEICCLTVLCGPNYVTFLRLYSMNRFGTERYRLRYSLFCKRARDCRDTEGGKYGSVRFKDMQPSEMKLAGERE